MQGSATASPTSPHQPRAVRSPLLTSPTNHATTLAIARALGASPSIMSNSWAGEPPLSYTTPDFPSLYWPIRASPGEPQYLYYAGDMWRFTLYWTLITVGVAHFLVALWAVLMQYATALQKRKWLQSPAAAKLTPKNRKLMGENPIAETTRWVWLVPLVYILMGGLEALVSGSLVGLILGAVYNAGYFKMSTWTPLFWGVINLLVLIVASFRVQGGL